MFAKSYFYVLIIFMKIIDAHSHIDYITHDIQPGVVGTICCTTDETQWLDLINMMNVDNRIYGCFGIHPWFVQNIKDGFEDRLYDLLKNNESFFVGEIGLDKYKPDIDIQIDVFKKQFDVAVKLHRTVFLHCVGAWEKIFFILKQYKKSELPVLVIHDFHGSDEILTNLLDNYKVMFSFNKIDKPQYIRRIELENILVETDGKADVILENIITDISDIKNNTYVADIIYNNTQGLLKHE